MKTRMKRTLPILVLFTFALALSACGGAIETQTRQVSGFDRVDISTFGEFIITQGDTESLSIEGPADYLRYLVTEVNNGTLTISQRRGLLSSPNRKVTFTLTVRDLTSLSMSGAGSIKLGTLNTPSFKLILSGAGSVDMVNLSAESLDVTLSAAGAISVDGKVTSQNIILSGVGSYDAGELESASTRITLSGAGSATVWVTEKLEADVTGVGSVAYYGQPTSIIQNVPGLGSIRSFGTK